MQARTWCSGPIAVQLGAVGLGYSDDQIGEHFPGDGDCSVGDAGPRDERVGAGVVVEGEGQGEQRLGDRRIGKVRHGVQRIEGTRIFL